MRVQYLIRTNSLSSDDRYQKTLAFLRECGIRPYTTAVVKTKSIRSDDLTEIILWSRKYLSSGSFLGIKYIEILGRVLPSLFSRSETFWFANFDFLPLQILLTYLRPRVTIIWDLHEMPPATFYNNRYLKPIFCRLLLKSRLVVCNKERLQSLEEDFGISLNKSLVLRNFPSETTIKKIQSRRLIYLNNEHRSRCIQIVILGGDLPGRYVRRSVELLLDLAGRRKVDLNITVVGSMTDPVNDQRCEVTGFLPFESLVERSVEGDISLCFYSLNSKNNIYCEPNRFYQAIASGQYVITFFHDTLVSINYPFHSVISEFNFEEDLEKVVWEIFSSSIPAAIRLKQSMGTVEGDLFFEAQFDNFKRWFEA